MVIDVGNHTQAVMVKKDNLDACADWAKPDGGCTYIKNRFGALEIVTRITAFKVHPGEWLMRRGPLVFKLTPREFEALYIGKDYGQEWFEKGD